MKDKTYVVAMGDGEIRRLRRYQYGRDAWRTMMTAEMAKEEARRWRNEIESAAGKPLPGCTITVLEALAGVWPDEDEPWMCQTHCRTDGTTAWWAV